MKRDVPKKIATDIAIEKQKLGMNDTSVPIMHEDLHVVAKPKKVKYECVDLLREDICSINDTKKLRAYVMCYARKTGDMSTGMKDAWKKSKSCKTFK